MNGRIVSMVETDARDENPISSKHLESASARRFHSRSISFNRFAVRGNSKLPAMIMFRLSELSERLQSARTVLAKSLRLGTHGKSIQILPGRRCATVAEVKRLTESLTKQSPSPHLHCFIGKANVFDCEAILGLLEQGQLSFSFSPGNGPRLNQEEIYHLVAFLEIPIHDHKTSEVRRRFYREWQRDLLTAGCRDPRASDAVFASTVDPTSHLPFSDETSTIDGVPLALGEANFDPTRMPVPPWTTRERLLRGGWFGMAIPTLDEEEEKRLIAQAFALATSAAASPQPQPARLLICGWYGTETLGDKAILGGAIIAARKRFPSLAIDVASLEPYVTKETSREMPDLRIGRILSFGEALAGILRKEFGAIAVVGPLMSSIRRCTHLFELFAAAKISGTKAIVAGCGLGPLQVEHRNAAIKHILELADEIVLRDTASAELARTTLDVKRSCVVAPDVAFLWIRRQRLPFVERDRRRVLLALRDWPLTEFGAGIDPVTAASIKERYEAELAEMLRELHRLEPSLEIVPFCMHKYFVGGDDRKFYRRLLKGFPEILARLDDRHRPPEEDLRFFASSRAVLAMRFHSVVFSLATKTPFLAVDYTMGGKIAGLLRDVEAPELIRSIADFDGKSTAGALLSVKAVRRDPDEFAMAVETALENAFAQTLQNGLATNN
jgi:polysaccharide pyruvyl transferase WcaK-like protein